MQSQITTPRLELNKLTIEDAEFTQVLVNSEEWIRFIGERNIKSKEDAEKYTLKIIETPNIIYWVVRLKEEGTPIGIITFIKRDYLAHHDIGFAFLSEYGKNGYAYEAANAVLKYITKDPNHKNILATTIKENTSSINLLEKLGLRFLEEIEVEKDLLMIYSINADKEL